jgi:hypothetical protein
VDVDPGTDDCEICSLREKCHDELGTICLGLFDDAVYKRFKERTDL